MDKFLQIMELLIRVVSMDLLISELIKLIISLVVNIPLEILVGMATSIKKHSCQIMMNLF